jgi:ribonuclease P protein component
MFSKKQRINREKIGNIFECPDFLFKSENFILRASKNELPYPRYAIVVSKKTEKSAVKRHFIKRKIISLIKKIDINKNLDFVINIKNNLNKKENKGLEDEIAKLINKCII